MPLIDLSLVTKTLVGLLSTRVRASDDWPQDGQDPNGMPLDVSPAAPDQVNAMRALSFYLYHVREDAHTRGQDWGVSGVAAPQRFKPMGLTLYYVMCPRSNLALGTERTYAEQQIMGLAVKTLHDYPFIDDDTDMRGKDGQVLKVLDPKLRNRDNVLRITMQPTLHTEAAQFWQAGSQALRMAAYYEVSAVLLEPEVITTRRTRVTMVGVHPVLRGQPTIDGTRNTLSFTAPGEADPRTVSCSPAEVALGGRLELFGSALKGDVTALLLNHTDFADMLAVDAAWQVHSDGATLGATIQASIVTPDGAQAVLPGVYGATVRTTTRRQLPNGTQRDFDNYSNTSSFAIAPRVTAAAPLAPDLSGSISVDGFVPAALTGSALALFVGTQKLQRAASLPVKPGEFIADPAPAMVIRFKLSSDVAPATALPLRLVVRGAESAPLWIHTP